MDLPLPSDTMAERLSWFAKMRAGEPVCHDNGEDVWHVFRHADVARVLTDSAAFSSDIREFLPPPEFATSFNNKGNFLLMDPPEHRQMRGLVSQAFTPRLVAGLAPRIAEVTAQLLDSVADRERFDIVDTVTIPLPVIIIAELLGLPSEDHRLFRQWGEVLIESGFEAEPSAESTARTAPTLKDMETYLLDQVRLRRGEPGDDILSGLIAVERNGERLDDEGIVGFATLLLISGHITTTSLLGNAVQCLDEHPEAADELRNSPELLPTAVEEVLRYRSPFTTADRLTTAEVELGGRTIPPGARVCGWLHSSNRDESVFTSPDVFDIRRQPNPHLGFGRGAHFCIGAPLARLEGEIALRELLSRYRRIRVERDAPLPYFSPGSNIHAAKQLPVRVATA
ncbi:cytochrome P450 [Nocardiopsis dassonvillei]|uniref:cytochrome P450 n=1 Tax=Nocardiopsis dassonvillei TaxID=2014 RepID=UPI00362BED74